MDSRSKRASRWLLPAALVSAALSAAIVADSRPASADTIVAGNLDEDEEAAAELAERHAQNCRFRDSAAYVNMRYRQVVDALREPQADDPNRAARLFGHILHGVQDFYSHSNWIPPAA